MKSIYLFLFFIFFSYLSHAKKIIIIGDSITDGYGISREKAYPALLEKKLFSKHEVIPMAISGSTTASAKGRLAWAMKLKPDLVLLALGANDGLRGIRPEETKSNLLEAIKILKSKKVQVVLVGMQMPPNYGKEYTTEFKKLFSEIAKSENVRLIPFLLEGVGGQTDLNQSDGIHPNEKGHEVIADTIFKQIKDIL